MVLDGQYSSAWYWVGALVMLGSFWIVNHEDVRNEDNERRGSEGILNVGDSDTRLLVRRHSNSVAGNV